MKVSFRAFRGPLFPKPVHRGAICQFPFRCIYYSYSSKPTGKESGKTHLCAVAGQVFFGHTVQHSGSSIATMLIIQKGAQSLNA